MGGKMRERLTSLKEASSSRRLASLRSLSSSSSDFGPPLSAPVAPAESSALTNPTGLL